MYMQVRIKREIFNGEFEIHYEFDSITRDELCSKYNLDKSLTIIYDSKGQVIEGDIIYDSLVTVVVAPAEAISLATWIILGITLLIAGATYVGTKIYYNNMREKLSNMKTVNPSYSYTVRGSQNQIRPNQGVGILLGRCNVCGDMAGQPYSSYNEDATLGYGEDQYLHQIVCNGYAPTSCGGVVVEKNSAFISSGNPDGYKVHIGDSPIDLYNDVALHVKTGETTLSSYYDKRMSEEAVAQKLNAELVNGVVVPEPIQRTSPTGTVYIGVGIEAPYGYYLANNNGGRDNLNMHYKVSYRIKDGNTWTTAEEVNRNLAVEHYRHMVTINVPAGQYDIRIENMNSLHPDDSKYCETLACELIQYQTKSANDNSLLPIKQPELYSLLSFTIKATDQLNGYIDNLYAKCHLKCKTYVGDYTETSNFSNYWVIPKYELVTYSTPIAGVTYYHEDSESNSYVAETNIASFASNTAYYVRNDNTTNEAEIVGTMNNPASVLLYVLTDPNINPRPVSYDQIDWVALREWFQFCSSNGRNWTCNAWVTERKTVADLAQMVCTCGRANLKFSDGLYSVQIEKGTNAISQVFTPRNAWDMSESCSFEDTPNLIRASFVNEDTETEEECYVYYEGNDIKYKSDMDDSSYRTESTAIWGVTNARQVEQLVAYQLAYGKLLTRSYSWTCGFDAVHSAVNDVVLLSNEIFLYSLGYGRVTHVARDASKILYIDIDESVKLDPSLSYGITIRKNDGAIQSVPVNQSTSTANRLYFTTDVAASVDIEKGNLFTYGEQETGTNHYGGRSVLITEIKHSTDGTATISAVDYIPSLYSVDISGTIPPYVSTISKYASGAQYNKGKVKYDGETPIIPGPAGLGSKYFGTRTWNATEYAAYTTMGYSDTWSNTQSVATITGDTLWLYVTNSTTGKHATLSLEVTAGAPASGAPTAKVVGLVEDGATGVSVTSTIQEYLSTSSSSPTGGSWSDTSVFWSVGYYIFKRTKYTYGDGSPATFSEPWYDSGLTSNYNAQVEFTISADRATYVRNSRITNQNTSIYLSVKQFGYNNVSYTYSTTTGSISDNVVTIPYNNTVDSIIITATATYNGQTISDSVTVTVDNQTPVPFYIGMYASSAIPTTTKDGSALIDNDWYLNSTDGKTYICSIVNNAVSWTQVTSLTPNFNEIALSTLPDKFSINSSVVIDEQLVENQYVKNLIARNVTAEYIGGKEIELLSGGSIHSKDYTQNTVSKLINNTVYSANATYNVGDFCIYEGTNYKCIVAITTAEPFTSSHWELIKKGFFQDTEGNAEFYKVDMYEANINKGNLTNVSVIGELNAETLTTLKNDAPSYQYRNKSSDKLWATADAVNALSSYPGASILNIHGMVPGRRYGLEEFYSVMRLDAQTRTQDHVLIANNNIQQNTTVSGTYSGPENSVKISGTPFKMCAYSLREKIESVAKMEVLQYGTWYEFTGENEITLDAGTTLSMRQTITNTTGANTYSKPVYNQSLYNAINTSATRMSDYKALFKLSNGNYVFVVSNNIAYSTDNGVTWSRANISSDFSTMHAVYANNQLTILLMYSKYAYPTTLVTTDGINYTTNNAQDFQVNYIWSNITYVNGYYYAYYPEVDGASTTFKAVRSSNGINWSSVLNTNMTDYLADTITVNNTIYGAAAYYIYKSTDGLNWTKINIRMQLWPDSISYVNNMFIISDSIGKEIVTTYDIENASSYSDTLTSYSNIIQAKNDNRLFSVYDSGDISTVAQITDEYYSLSLAGQLNAKYNYSTWTEDLYFFNQQYSVIRAFGSTEYSIKYLTTSQSCTCLDENEQTIFDSDNSDTYEYYIGMQYLQNNVWVTDQANEYNKIYNGTLSYKKIGTQNTTTVTNITSVKWDSDSLTVIENRSIPHIFSNSSESDLLSVFSITFTPISRLRGNYIESTFPEALPNERTGDITLGSQNNPFDEVYSTKFIGNVTGNITGNVTGNVTGSLSGNVTGDVTGNLTGNVSGTVTGNVNGTTVTASVVNGTTIYQGSSSSGDMQELHHIHYSTQTPQDNQGSVGDLWVVYS